MLRRGAPCTKAPPGPVTLMALLFPPLSQISNSTSSFSFRLLNPSLQNDTKYFRIPMATRFRHTGLVVWCGAARTEDVSQKWERKFAEEPKGLLRQKQTRYTRTQQAIKWTALRLSGFAVVRKPPCFFFTTPFGPVWRKDEIFSKKSKDNFRFRTPSTDGGMGRGNSYA
jgi:hypothetical protein